jgi:solute carrier family 35
VPMFIVLRRFTMVLTIALEHFWFRKTHDWQVVGAIGVMILGAIIAAATDLSFNFVGYLSLAINDFFTAAYLVMVKHLAVAKQLDTTTLLFYNALVSVGPLMVAAWATGEMQALGKFEGSGSIPFRVTAVAAVCMGLTISHSTYVCTRLNEPLTTSVAGSFKNILMTVIGMMAFGDYVFEWMNMTGIGVSMLGAIWYAWYGATKAT